MDLLYLIILFKSFFHGIDTVIMKSVNLKTIIDSSNILLISEEESILACVQRCKFRHKNAAIRFQSQQCICFTNNDMDDTEDYDHGTVSGIFLDKKMKKMMAKIHGGWSSWRSLTECTKPCGSGTLKQGRGCDSPKPEYGGAVCLGKDKRTVKCNTQECIIVNVALGKAARQSSTLGDGFASKAVDGDTGTEANTNWESDPWWEVDLGNLKMIKEIRLNAYVHENANNGLLVETRTKREESWSRCNNIGDIENLFTKFNCNQKPTYSRFVRIRSTKSCNLHLYEVEILGHESK